jgi:group I intron endonuclease
MQEEDRRGVIYKLTCTTTEKSYIGQARLFKIKDNKPYNYGSMGRWNDHKSSAKTSTTPLSEAINQYGEDNFVITDIEIVDDENMDLREAYWIQQENTVVPNGYNVSQHSRSKHNSETTLHELFTNVKNVELHPVKKDGEYNHVYLYIYFRDNTSRRLTFGQNSYNSYTEAVAQAREFALKLNCDIVDYTAGEYKQQHKTMKELKGNIKEVVITTASKLVGVYILTDEMKQRKEMIRICFGGKTKTSQQAYEEAKEYIKSLQLQSHVKLIDKISS